MNAMISIPDETIEDLRTGLHSVLGTAAEQIADVTTRPGRERHPEWYEQPLEELQHAMTVLDIIGWSRKSQPAQVSLDARAHRSVLLEALDIVLQIVDDNLQQMIARARTEGAERDRLARRMGAMSDLTEAIEARAPARDDRQAGNDQRPTGQREPRRGRRRSSRARHRR